MDKNGYPEEDELETIRKWDFKRPVSEFIEHIRSLWQEGYGIFRFDGKRLELITGGWSGNEDVLDAIADTFFWTLYWKESHRGGKYVFEIQEINV